MELEPLLLFCAATLLLAANALAFTAQRRGHIGRIELLLLQSASLATATAAAGLTQWHHLFKPLTMLIAIALVASFDRFALSGPSGKRWLLAALAGSLAGDLFLMFDDFFVPGLVSFLLAHLAYIGLLRKDTRWFPRRWALAATLAPATAMYAFLWSAGLPAPLRAPVAAYVAVIALMTAQALGRAAVLRTRASWLMAAGACCFMLSDSLLATDKFALALPLARFWVLLSYYAAQLLLVGGWMRSRVNSATKDGKDAVTARG